MMNGAIKRNWNGEFTYVGTRGNTVTDFVIVNEKIYNKVFINKDFKIVEKVNSDHLPLQLRLKRKEQEEAEEEREEEEKMRRGKMKEIISWEEEAIRKYKEKTELLEQEVDQEK